MKTMVFSDVDGTLLTSKKEISKLTEMAIKKTIKQNIPFVITSSRFIESLYKIRDEYNLSCYVIGFGGALIVDNKKNILYENKMDYLIVKNIIDYLDENYDVAWNVYSLDKWIVKNKNDLRVINEERIAKVKAQEGNINEIKNDIFKILCICNKDDTLKIENELKIKFPDCHIVKSSPILLEISSKEVNKAMAIKKLCKILNYDINDVIAFGDNYNDLEMLQEVGYPFLMDNAPNDLKKVITSHTLSNDEDGIYYALKKMNLIGD